MSSGNSSPHFVADFLITVSKRRAIACKFLFHVSFSSTTDAASGLVDILSVAVFRNAKLAYIGESRAPNTSTTKNGSKFDRGRGHLPGGTKPLLPQRRRICADGNAKIHILNFGIGWDQPIRTYLRMCRGN